jgi:chromosome segregation ATPase
MGMGEIKLLSLALATSLTIGSFVPAVYAAPKTSSAKPGVNCKTAFEVAKHKSQFILCVSINGQRTWVRINRPPTNKSSATNVVNRWLASVPLEDVEASVTALLPQQEHLDEVTRALQERDATSTALNEARLSAQHLQSEIANLPNQIAQALAISDQAKAAMQPSLNELKAAEARVSSLSGSYSSALNTQAVLIAEITLCMFGFRSCRPGQYDAELARAGNTIAQYESAVAVANSARTKYDGFYNDYKRKYDAYAALFNRRNTANSELAKANGDIQSLQAVIPSLDDTLMRAQKRIQIPAQLEAMVPIMRQLETNLQSRAKLVTVAKNDSWVKSFAQTQGIWLQLSNERAKFNKYVGELQNL